MPGSHRVVDKRHRAPDGRVLEPGDRYAPTEAELAAFPHRFEPVDDDEPDGPMAAGDDAMSPAEAKSVLDDHGVESDNYTTLQRMASEYDDIAGNQSKVELQVQLARKLTAE